jgi:hypothetical protein
LSLHIPVGKVIAYGVKHRKIQFLVESKLFCSPPLRGLSSKHTGLFVRRPLSHGQPAFHATPFNFNVK